MPRWFLRYFPALLFLGITNGHLQQNKDNLDYVNLLVGTTGPTPNESGGMVPSVAPPFGMTRWVAQTQVSYVSATPYNASWGLAGGDTENTKIHGFMATRQPAIWMGESGSISFSPGVLLSKPNELGPLPMKIRADFEGRGLPVVIENGTRKEVITPSYYSVTVDDLKGGTVLGEMSATSRVGHIRYTFQGPSGDEQMDINDGSEDVESHRHHSTPPHLPQRHPYVLLEVSRPSIITSTPTNITYPTGSITLLPYTEQPEQNQVSGPFEICGYSSERQDAIITPLSGQTAAEGFKAYFCARFHPGSGAKLGGVRGQRDTSIIAGYGIIQNGTAHVGKTTMDGALLSAFVFLPEGVDSVEVRVGTSFVSVEQARANLEEEVPNGTTLEETAATVKSQWKALFDRANITVGGEEEEEDEEATMLKEVWWTALAHALQYPSEQHEQTRYWSGYDGKVHTVDELGGVEGGSYTGYSIWDTYRAIWALQILVVPERIPGMVQSMLADFRESGWLPMWKNVVETNIMIGTHADSMIAEALLKNITGFDTDLAWEAVWKDCSVPPERDWEVQYDDREEHVDYEVRAGLTSVYDDPEKGWVADDVHSESASRTLAYAYDDYAASILASLLHKPQETIDFLYERAMRAPFTLYNDETGFLEARKADGSWAGEERGWTEGDKWAYTFDIVHAIPQLIERRGGKVGFVKSLEKHFEEGHNDHANEPSHHIPYLYALSGAAFKAQERIRQIAKENYNNQPRGLSGNEDCGQMSAWFMFSAMGFYPVNPASGEYVIGTPFFEKITLDLPNPYPRTGSTKLRISAPGARVKPYIKSVTINGMAVVEPVIRHEQLFAGGDEVDVVFEMSDVIEEWGNDAEVLQAMGVRTVWMELVGAKESRHPGKSGRDEL